jgi:hypothetical protein
MTIRAKWTLGCLASVLALAIVACSSPSGSPRAAAEAFLDAHYVRIDLEAARAFCAGLALEKLEREIALLKDHEEASAAERPRVTYRLEEAHDADERAQYAYELAVHPTGTDPFHKLIVLSLRDEGSGWRVSNYSESDR